MDDTDLTVVEPTGLQDTTDSDYDPIQHLSRQQINCVLRMVLFPEASNAEIAKAVQVKPATVSRWKQDPHFKAFLIEKQRKVVDGAVEAHTARTAHLYDKLTAEILDRLEDPVTDKDKLEEILGPEYTRDDKRMYQERFVKNLPADKLFKIWGAFDDRVREDAQVRNVGENEEVLVMRVRQNYTDLMIRRKRMRQFEIEHGYDHEKNIHDEAENIFDQDGYIDVEFQEVASSDSDSNSGTEDDWSEYELE